ncbi:hypothetical protein [uncultured Herbaspirillum sp.]|uniref:hypothetical protein n=1 Tax=uncultured Herbaspirillum sp. TaxID=160236 RepID=UPI0026398791|nr:hypothetical protein [uncultured Herbaspirillum sp.]
MRLLSGKEVENEQKSSSAGLLHEKSLPEIQNSEISELTRAIFPTFFSMLLGPRPGVVSGDVNPRINGGKRWRAEKHAVAEAAGVIGGG